MDFTTGQIVFAVLFFIAFVVIITISYRKDLKLHQKYYTGTFYILLGFLLFIGLLFVIKHFLNS